MPIIRKLIQFGKTSKAIILPKSWLEFYEQQTGIKIEKVAVEVNRSLIIQPILTQKENLNNEVRQSK